MVIIYLSDGYKGGNSTFLTQNINYNLENKIRNFNRQKSKKKFSKA